MSKFLQPNHSKAVKIPQVFSENSQAKNEKMQITTSKDILSYPDMKPYVSTHLSSLEYSIAKLSFLQVFLRSNKSTMMVLYRSPEHICNLYGLSRAGY